MTIDPKQRISSVKFLRTLAESFGGINSSRGRGLHKAAGHMIRMDEELQRCRAMALAVGEDHLLLAAQGIHRVVKNELRADGKVTRDWPMLDEETQTRFMTMARASHGMPVIERPVEEEDLQA